MWCVEATGKPISVLTREGWTPDEIETACAAKWISVQLSHERENGMLGGK